MKSSEEYADHFRNNLERRLGTEEYERIGAEGHDDPDNKGRYSAREVISEVRNRDGKTVDEMADYFQGLKDDGVKFNKRALAYLDKIGGSGGGGGTPDTPPQTKPYAGFIPSGGMTEMIYGYNPVDGHKGYDRNPAGDWLENYKGTVKKYMQPDGWSPSGHPSLEAGSETEAATKDYSFKAKDDDEPSWIAKKVVEG